MPIKPGTRLGPYEIIATLGEGGMGEVYRARDTSLNRDVAIKVMPEAVAGDAERLARFQREAESLAALNHPNIATIYGIHGDGAASSASDPRPLAIVMELIEGPTLADRIAGGPVAIEDALPIARQIADALEAAHERGIVHRDLKPANIKIRDDGTVKVLDFGLAKAIEGVQGDGSGLRHQDPSPSSPTMTSPAQTQMGVILGTAAYMSPEQARGKAVDKRADVWAFGAVLYEMLTGAAAFPGDDVTSTIARVIERDPDWDALPDGVPATLQTFLRRCLEKDPKRRVRDIGDVRLALDGAFDSEEGVGGRVEQPSAHRQMLAAALGGLVLGAALVWLAGWTSEDDVTAPVTRTVVDVAPNPLVRPDVDSNRPAVVISPDGSRVVYRAVVDGERALVVRELAQLNGVLFEGSEITPFDPFFSPDGRWIGFMPLNGPLQKVLLPGGPAETICELPTPLRGASWGADGTIVFGVADGRLMQVPADGGEPEPLTVPDGELHWWPAILPDGDGVLFTILSDRGFQIAVLDLETRRYDIVFDGGMYGRYSPTGHLLYVVDQALRAVPFDLGSRQVTGDPVHLLDGLTTRWTGAADFGLADTGALVYVTGPGASSEDRTFVWVDGDGLEEAVPIPAGRYASPRLSPDGRQLAVSRLLQEQSGVWTFDVATGAGLALTQEGGGSAVWTPDGARLVFSRGGDLYTTPADRSGPAELLLDSQFPDTPLVVTPDGSTLLFARTISPARQRDLWSVSLDGDPAPAPVDEGRYVADASLSADGRWLFSNLDSMSVRAYPGPGATVPIPRGPGSASGLVLARDDSAIYYRNGPANQFIGIDVTLDAGARFGIPRVLFEDHYVTEGAGASRQYDVAPDGRFLMMKPVEVDPAGSGSMDGPAFQLVLVQNWFEELERLAEGR